MIAHKVGVPSSSSSSSFFVTAWQVHLVSASSCVNESKEKVVYCVVVFFHPENWSISSC